MQGAIQEDIPVVVQIHASRVEEVKAGEVSFGDNDYVLVSDPGKDFYENLEELFANCKLVDEDLELLRVNAVSTVEHFKHIEVTRFGTRRLDIKSKKTLQRLEPRVPKENGIGIAEGRYPGSVDLVIGDQCRGP